MDHKKIFEVVTVQTFLLPPPNPLLSLPQTPPPTHGPIPSPPPLPLFLHLLVGSVFKKKVLRFILCFFFSLRSMDLCINNFLLLMCSKNSEDNTF